MKTRILPLLLALLLSALPALASNPMDVYNGHILLDDMGEGSCQRFTGAIPLAAVFVSVEASPWTQDSMNAMKSELLTASRMLRSEAAYYGTQLNISLQYHAVTAASAPPLNASRGWVDGVLAELSALSPRTSGESWQNMPLLFFVSTDGRAFAHCETSVQLAEYVVLYQADDSGALRHELRHLFGAKDYSVEPTIEAAALELCPDSIMLTCESDDTVDDVTAYVIGWTIRPASAGLQLLHATSGVTPQDFVDAQIADQRTGLGTSTTDGVTYTGMMLDGVHHGWGQQRWPDGDAYLGYWYQGSRTGQGIYTWEDGSVYTGGFSGGQLHGYGVLRLPTGETYTGEFLNGCLHGHGVFIWPDGTTYAGDFCQDERTGSGCLTMPNGDVYNGEFLQGSFHGTGTYFWADGSSHTGSFAQGDRHGEGVYRDADGGILRGMWQNGSYSGPIE